MRRGAHHAGPGSECGSALIEVLVSAAIFVAIALATLSAVDRAQKTSLNAKNRSVAATLADQDQDRLRAMKAADLTTLGTASRSVSVANVNYTVTSSAAWIRDDAGVPESCTDGDGSSASYIKITSTVAAPAAATESRPVSVTSFVTPPTAVFGPNQGTLAVKVVDRAGNPVQGMTVTTSGPKALNAPTNSAGCAVFSRVPVGTYHVLLNQSGWVDPSGSQAVDVTQEVTTGNLNVKTVTYDRAATVRVSFNTQPLGGTAVTSRAWGATAENTAPVLMTRQSSGSSPAASFDLTNVFPSSSGTRVWAGGCTAANPVSAIPDANYFSAPPGSLAAPVLTPGVVNNVTTRLPALNLTVTGNTTSNGTSDVVLKSTSAGACAATTKIVMRANTASAGRATKTWVSGSAVDPGVPFGTYEICIDNNGSNNTNGSSDERRRKVLQGAAAIGVLNAINGSNPVTIDFTTNTPGVLTRGSVNGSTNSQCNTTATSSTFLN